MASGSSASPLEGDHPGALFQSQIGLNELQLLAQGDFLRADILQRRRNSSPRRAIMTSADSASLCNNAEIAFSVLKRKWGCNLHLQNL